MQYNGNILPPETVWRHDSTSLIFFFPELGTFHSVFQSFKMRQFNGFGASAGATAQAGCFPVESSTTPYWRSQLHSIDQHRSTDELPAECDVAIVGSGMAGVSVAYHLTKGLKDGESAPGIVMLEARQVCSGATGRNGVSMLPLRLQNVTV